MRTRRDRALGMAIMEALESRRMLTAFALNNPPTIQTYTVPLTGIYEVTAAGAQGGGAYYYGSGPGGLGAVLSGEVMLTAGTTLDVVVGGQGGEGEYSGGGGGGSFVYAPSASEPLIVAGGGGGGWVGPSLNALTGIDGGGGSGAGAGGVNGSGGKGGSSGDGDGGGGAGWSSAGTGSTDSGTGGTGGLSQPTFAAGASPSDNESPYYGYSNGGFGGGGAGGGDSINTHSASGGGGGYSGGGGGTGGNYNSEGYAGRGAGGGSYIASSFTNTNAAVTQTGDGSVNFVYEASVTTAAQPGIGQVGLGIADKATIFGVSPTGTVTFNLYDNANASGTPLYTDTENVTGTVATSGVATSAFYGATTTGTYYWVATYNGDSNNLPATSNSGSDPVVVISGPGDWMAAEPDGVPLTDISLPGTVNSAAGPGLSDALIGSGSSSVLAPTTVTGVAANNTALAAHLADSVAVQAALAATPPNVALNSAAVAADTAALAADSAAGITQTSAGAGLAVGLVADTTAVASDSAALAASTASQTTDPADTTAAADDSAVQAADTTAAADHEAAATDDAAAAGPDGAAGGADTTAAGADKAAELADGTAGGEDATAAGADESAAGADVAAGAEDGIDPVADFIAAGFDGTASGADAAAVGGNIGADAADLTADATDGTATGLDNAVGGVNMAASGADLAANGSDTAAETANSKAITDYTMAAGNHTTSAAADALSATANFAGAAANALTASFYGSFAMGMSTPNTTGNNSNNVADQNAVNGLALAEASTHSAAAALQTTAGGLASNAANLQRVAAAADLAAVNALTEADAMDAAAEEANATAEADDAKATEADAMAAELNETASGDNSGAVGLDSAAEGLDIAAAADNGITAGAETAAGAADTAAIALDVIAAATAEIIFVDIGTAAAAAVGEAAAVALDEVSVGADATDVPVDGATGGIDAAAAPVDEAAAAEDGLANAADELAAEADATAAAADGQATTDDEMVATADTKATALSKDADEANEAADAADALSANEGKLANASCALAATADVMFTTEMTILQDQQTTLQTQTLSIADQLDTGVRSLDLQAGLVNDTINLNSGQYFTGYTLQGAMNEMTSFLQAEPTETIVVSLSNDATPVNSTNSFNTDLSTLLNSPDTAVPGLTYNDFVYSSDNSALTPTLGDVRGKIVFVPNADQSWTPPAGLGWQPTEVDQNSPTITDPNTRWNYAENDNGANDSGLIPTDLGDPSTLYRNNTTQDFVPDVVNGSTVYPMSAVPVGLGDEVDAIAQQYFTGVKVSRTTGIVGMDDPTVVETGDTTANLGDGTAVDETLINAIINENNPPIIVTSDSDAPDAAGTLRDAILLANSEPGLHDIEFAPNLSGPTDNVIILQSDLPVVTNDLVVAGPVVINTNGYQGFQLPTPDMHTVTENDYVASDSGPPTPTPSTDTPPVYVDTSGVTITTLAPLLVDPVNITYGTALSNSQLQGIAFATMGDSLVTIPGTFTFTSAAQTVLDAGSGQTEAVTFTPADTMAYASESATVIVNVAKAIPVIASISPVNIAYGTALANTQLSGTVTFDDSTVPGNLVYTNDAGGVPYAGNGQSEPVTFIPTDPTDYASVFSTVTVNVAQVEPIVTVNAVDIVPGTELDNNQLSGTATSTVNGSTVSVQGLFSYTTSAGTVLNAGTGQPEDVTFTPNDATDYETVDTSATVNVAQSSPVAPSVTVNPVNIAYGTALANGQLSGSATYPIGGTPTTIPGTFAYTTATGVLLAGAGQSEAVTFTPDDTANYAPVSLTATVNVAPATPTVTAVSPVSITYGTLLANTQLSGSASYVVNGITVAVPGAFSYTSAASSQPGAGNGQSEAVTFTPTDGADYSTASSTVTINVAQAVPAVTGVNALNITYGTVLANTQLTGTATYTLNGSAVAVPGTFTYTSAAGTMPSAGNGQSVAVTFTPTDSTDFTTASSTVTVNVAQAMPTVTVTDAGGAVTSSPFPASGTVTGVGNANLGTPTFTYFAATDVTFSDPLPGAPSALGRYVVVGSYAANGNYAVGAAVTGFAIYTPPPPVNPTITTAAQPATATLGSSIADKVTVTGNNPTGVVTFSLFNNATATLPALFTDTEPLSGGIATSTGFVTTSAALGTDYWVATYCGDDANNPATTVANAEPVTVSGSLVVNSTSDSSTAMGNTLRDAVAYANTLGAGTHAITFDPTIFAASQTITLSSPLTLSDASGTTTITGPASSVTLSGGNSVGLFDVEAGVTATLSDLSLIDGKSSSGGAIVDQGTLTITNSTLSGNTSTGLGGAIVVTGSLTVENSTLASNSAAASGGAIENVGSLTVLDSTLSANQAGTGGSGSGGAIDNIGNGYSLTIGDSIVAGNSATSAPNVSNAVTSQGNNLIGATDGSSGWISSDLTGTVAIPLNPLLASSLANNGGPTQTLALLSTSPAIGAGAPINGITTDQRGFGRPASSPDIGAYQSEAVVTVTDAGGTYNASPYPATAASATGSGGLSVTALADFTFSYAGTGSTTYAASSTAPTNAGTYTVTATYLGNATHASSSSLATPFTISKASSTTTVTDAGGTYNGNPFPATAASATGAGGLNNTTLADFTFSYAGTGSTTYPASSTAPTIAGTYTVTATYLGDANHNSSSSTPLPFAIIGQIAPSITATAGATIVIGANAPLSASATLSGAVSPTGSITFTLYSPSNTVVFTNAVKVTANGAYSSTATGTTTGSAVPTAAGTYQWVASYSGDANNKSATTSKGATPETAAGAGETVVGNVLYIVGGNTSSSLSVTPIGSSQTGTTGILLIGLLNGSLVINVRMNQTLASIEYYGLNGNDSINLSTSLTLPATVIEGNGNDKITVGAGNNTITLGNGNDSVTAGNGNNTITAGNGNNTIQVGSGNNTINVGTGSNTISGGNGNNVVTAASIASGNGNVSVQLGNGNDTVNVGNGANTIQLGSGKNSITAGNGNNFVSVAYGSDSILVGNGNNIVVGGTGNDTITAGSGDNLLIGGLGADSIRAGNGKNILIDGSVQLTHTGDTLQSILSTWITGGSSSANVANISARIKVTYNTTNSNTLQAGSGLDWFWYTDSKDLVNRKATDLLN